jgi:hypothetical protein
MTGADPVAGLQFNLIARTDYARFVGMADTPRPGGFDRSAFPHDDTTRFVVFSGARALIPPGADIPILTARYLLHSTAPLGSTTPLVFTAVEISDSAGFAFHDSTLNSQLQTGLRGDLNLDGRVSILDVVRLARALVGQDTAPDSGSVFFHIADANGDGRITIGDIIVQVNIILGIPPGPPPVKALSATVTVRSGAPIGQDDGTLAAPIYLEPEGLVAGLSASFLLEGGLGVGTARVSGGSSGFGVASHSVGDMLRVWPSAWTGDGRWARGKTR